MSHLTNTFALRKPRSVWRGWGGYIRWAWNRAKTVARHEGLGSCLRRLTQRLARVLRGEASVAPYGAADLDRQYRRWRNRLQLTSERLQSMKDDVARLTPSPTFVCVMLLSDAKTEWLVKSVESFRAQVYPYWRLVICGDGRTSQSVQELVNGFTAGDERITFRRGTTESLNRPLVWSLLMQSAGEFVGLFGQHDELAPEALLALAQKVSEYPDTDLMYSDHDTISPSGGYVDPFFKPEWSPDLLLSMNYLAPLCLFRRTALLNLMGGEIPVERRGLHGLLLRFTEVPRRISHVPLVLYHERARCDGQGLPDENWKRDQQEAAAVITEALRRRGEAGVVTYGGGDRFLVSFQVVGAPLVSIIIPTRDHGDLLARCIDSIEKQTRYVRYEIIVVDNGTTDERTRCYLDSITARHRVMRYPGAFNYSAINNEGVKQAAGDYLLFLNNDTEALSPQWLSAMVAQAQRPGVGAVGAKLLYPDGRIQHAGVVLGLCGVAGHAFRHCPSGRPHYHGLSDCMRNCSAVTAACMMVSRRMFAMAGGFDEQLPVEFNDVDLCLRIQRLGGRIVYTPEAVLYHYENATRKGRRVLADEKRFALQWEELLAKGDPYYNPNLTRRREDWSLDV